MTANTSKATKNPERKARKSCKMTTELVKSVGQRITELEPRLIAIAKKIAKYEQGSDWQDYYQGILKALLERNHVDPDFFKQTNSYILKYGEYMARHQASKAKVYLQYVGEEGVVDPEDSDSDTEGALDLMVERTKLQQSIGFVESEVMNSELGQVLVEGCDHLSKSNIQIVYMLYLGYSQKEIADILKISKPAVTQRMATIKSVIAGFVQGY